MTEEGTHMVDPTPGGTRTGPDGKYPGMPRWVRLFGLIALGLVVLLVVVLVVATALGLHTPGGPGGHGTGQVTPPRPLLASVMAGDALSGGELAGLTARSSVTGHGL